MRQSAQPGSSQVSERDHEIHVEWAFQLQPQPAFRVLGREGAGANADAGVAQVPAHRRTRVGAEDAEWRGLAADQLDRQVQPAPSPVLGRNQRQLVERKGPSGADHGDERDRVPASGGQRLDRLPDGQDVPRAGEGDGARQRGLRLGADGQEQRVVGNSRTVSGVELARAGTHGFEQIRDPARAAVAGDALPVVSVAGFASNGSATDDAR